MKMEKNMSIRPWPEPWQYRGWVSNLKTELARLVAPYGKEVMQWLSGVFRLEGDADPVPDEALQNSGEFPKLDGLLANELTNAPKRLPFSLHPEEVPQRPPLERSLVDFWPRGVALYSTIL